ncbi:unnamed protein product, partial [Laminaria digitata]
VGTYYTCSLSGSWYFRIFEPCFILQTAAECFLLLLVNADMAMNAWMLSVSLLSRLPRISHCFFVFLYVRNVLFLCCSLQSCRCIYHYPYLLSETMNNHGHR